MAVASTDDDTAILQKAPPNSCALSELTQATCGIGTWTLRVVQPRVIQYNYNWQGQERQGKRLECILLSEDSDSYCMGMVKRTGTADAAERNFKQLVEKFNENSIWNMSRITLVAEKVQFIGSPVKHVIDLVKTKVVPVLQSTTFPKIPTPPESLATIVTLPRKQQVHFLALVRAVEKQRTATTSRGDRTIVDVTFVDGWPADQSGKHRIHVSGHCPFHDCHCTAYVGCLLIRPALLRQHVDQGLRLQLRDCDVVRAHDRLLEDQPRRTQPSLGALLHRHESAPQTVGGATRAPSVLQAGGAY